MMKRILCSCITVLSVLCFISQPLTAHATEQPCSNSEIVAYVMNEKGIIETADVTLESHNSKQVNGELIYTDIYVTDELEAPVETSGISPASSIEGVENFVKYTGRISVSYTKNDTTAKLVGVTGTWTYAHGTYVALSYTNVTYGQVLGTNSANGTAKKYGTSFSINSGFSAGKYGYNRGHFLGANMTGYLTNGTSYYVEANLYL